MKKKYPVVTLCGSTRFKDEFMRAQKMLTLQGCIVISVGLFGHAGDKEVWDGMDEGTLSRTKYMLDDMHKEKIDMADRIYVVNPGGYIGRSTWSEICYAEMTGKHIDSLETIDRREIEHRVAGHLRLAEDLAARQYDVFTHLASDYPMEYFLDEMAYIEKKKAVIFDPWVPEDEKIPTELHPEFTAFHAAPDSGYDPFVVYGKKEMARFVEDIIARNVE